MTLNEAVDLAKEAKTREERLLSLDEQAMITLHDAWENRVPLPRDDYYYQTHMRELKKRLEFYERKIHSFYDLVAIGAALDRNAKREDFDLQRSWQISPESMGR